MTRSSLATSGQVIRFSSGEPGDLIQAERKSLFYHSMAHTDQALTLFFGPPTPQSRRDIDAICQHMLAIEGRDVGALRRAIRRRWDSDYREKFEAVRNFVVAHYPVPEATKKRPVDSYWQTLTALLASGDVRSLTDGSIVVPGFESTDGRYRHTLVDTLQDAFLDALFPPVFWADGGACSEVAKFLDDATTLVNALVVPLIQRLEPNLLVEDWAWDGERWQPAE